jgi:hypothetical protein
MPATTMPRRDHYFAASVGGNMISNANITAYNASTNGTIWGVSGRYDKSVNAVQGRKAYGNPNQGDMQMANLTNQANSECLARNLLVAVTALQDNAYVKLDFSAVQFYRPPAVNTTSGASFLSMTVAAVIGLISLAFF